MDRPIETYLKELRRALRGNPLLMRRILEEVADHLAAAAAEERKRGMSDIDAERSAVRRFGPPETFARGFDRYVLPFRYLLALASLVTVVVALWLLYVVAAVLPSRDPADVPFWRAVAAAYLAFSALSWAYLVKGPRLTALRWVVLAASSAAVALGLYGVFSMILLPSGAHFEGYLVLMGILLAGHGSVGLAYALLTTRIARRVRLSAGG